MRARLGKEGRNLQRARFTNHAAVRLEERGDARLNGKTKHLIRSKLFEDLKVGMPTIPGGAVEVEVNGVKARAVPSVYGGWDVVTVVREG
jgi:hypothetical protein